MEPPPGDSRPLDPSDWFVEGGARQRRSGCQVCDWPHIQQTNCQGSRGRLSLGGGSKGAAPTWPFLPRTADHGMKGRSDAWQAGGGAKAVPFRCRGPHPDQGAADTGSRRCRAVPLAGGVGLSVVRRPRCAATGRCIAGGDCRPDGSHRPLGRAAALLFRGRHPDIAVAIDRVAGLSGPAGASVRRVLRPRRHQVSAGAGGGDGGAARGFHAGSGGARCCWRSPATARRI